MSTTFVSSALVICEAQSSSSAGKSAAFMLQHDSHPTPDGQQAICSAAAASRRVSRGGPRVVAIGGSVAISSSAVDETTPAMLSWQSRVGCSFGGVWVAATAGATALDVKCVVPATNVGELFVTTSDLNSRTPLPFFDDGVKHAGEPKHLGRRAVTVTESPVVSEFVPSAGTPIIRGTSMNVDVYGDHLHVDTTSAPLLHLCLTLSRTLDDVRLNCVVAINAGTSALEAANAFSVGFNAVNVRGGASDRGERRGSVYASEPAADRDGDNDSGERGRRHHRDRRALRGRDHAAVVLRRELHARSGRRVLRARALRRAVGGITCRRARCIAPARRAR